MKIEKILIKIFATQEMFLRNHMLQCKCSCKRRETGGDHGK